MTVIDLRRKKPARHGLCKTCLWHWPELFGGTTCTDMNQPLHWNCNAHTFMSCEPMLAPWNPAGGKGIARMVPEWVIFGAETGNRKGRVMPKKEWVSNAVRQCRNNGSAIFMKESLREIMGEDFVQEFPWEVRS